MIKNFFTLEKFASNQKLKISQIKNPYGYGYLVWSIVKDKQKNTKFQINFLDKDNQQVGDQNKVIFAPDKNTAIMYLHDKYPSAIIQGIQRQFYQLKVEKGQKPRYVKQSWQSEIPANQMQRFYDNENKVLNNRMKKDQQL